MNKFNPLGLIKKIQLLDLISFMLMLLFIYAATTKLLEYQLFQAQIGKSPLITKYAGILAWLVPSIELIVATMLLIPALRLIGFYGSFCLMFLFTAYISFILTYSPYIPCSCGGVLSSMGWKEHLVFNIGFTMLAILGITLEAKRKKSHSYQYN